MFVYNFLLRQTNFLLSPNSRCCWTELTNRTMRRAFGPSESHAFFLSLGPPFCTEGWASSLSRSDHVWMCSSFVFRPSYFCFIREFVIWFWCCDSVMSLPSYHFLSCSFLPFFNWHSLSVTLSNFGRLGLLISHSLMWLQLIFAAEYFRINSWVMFFICSVSHRILWFQFIFSWWYLPQSSFSERSSCFVRVSFYNYFFLPSLIPLIISLDIFCLHVSHLFLSSLLLILLSISALLCFSYYYCVRF